MCGIVGYVGQEQAAPILLDGLSRLEYRGYDSAGVAVYSQRDQSLSVYKSKGRLQVLSDMLQGGAAVEGTIGVGHTRWATHGAPSDVNSHPQVSRSGRIAVVHNGIIENYLELKKRLIAKGYVFKSETDTEVVTLLLDYYFDGDLLKALSRVMHRIEGSYALGILNKDNPDEIIAARKSSPLVVGIGEDEFFLASDATPIVEYTDKVVYLEDEEIALIRRGEKLKVVNLKNVECPHEVKTVALNLGQLEKGGYPHFMLKEIFEQPGCIHDCMRGRINVEGTNVVLSLSLIHI